MILKKFFIPVAVLLAILILWNAVTFFYRVSYPNSYDDFVIKYAEENNLPTELVYGVIHTESNMDPAVVSSVGARGLMQITEDTYDWAKMRMGGDDTTYDDLFDAETNIKYGCYILRLLIDRFDDLQTALCAYHAGAGNVQNWLTMSEYSSDGKIVDKIPYKNTHWYVDRVLSTMDIYKGLYNKEGDM